MTKGVKILGLDADGVLLDYLAGLWGHANSVGLVPAVAPQDVDDFSILPAFPGKDAAWIKSLIQDFSITPEFANVPIIPGAVEALTDIKSILGDSIKIVVVTSAGASKETIRLREKNLEAFPVDDIHVLPLGGDKRTHLSKFGTGSIFVDDLMKNINDAESVGVTGVLYRQAYNRSDMHSNTMDNWIDGQKLILDLLQQPELKLAM